jgi:hypothetical protein
LSKQKQTPYKMKNPHYSEVLKKEIENRNELLKILSDELTDTLIHLSSNKFQGFPNNFVNAQEMASRILEIRNIISTNI